MKKIESDFLELMEENKFILVKITSFYALTKEEREDLFSEMVYHLWKSYPSFKNKSKLSTWIYKVCLNVAAAHNRTKARKINMVMYDFFPENMMNRKDADKEQEEIKWLYESINTLPPLSKSLILLYLDGLKYSEIAEIMGISESNVGVRINRIKAELKKHFK